MSANQQQQQQQPLLQTKKQQQFSNKTAMAIAEADTYVVNMSSYRGILEKDDQTKVERRLTEAVVVSLFSNVGILAGLTSIVNRSPLKKINSLARGILTVIASIPISAEVIHQFTTYRRNQWLLEPHSRLSKDMRTIIRNRDPEYVTLKRFQDLHPAIAAEEASMQVENLQALQQYFQQVMNTVAKKDQRGAFGIGRQQQPQQQQSQAVIPASPSSSSSSSSSFPTRSTSSTDNTSSVSSSSSSSYSFPSSTSRSSSSSTTHDDDDDSSLSSTWSFGTSRPAPFSTSSSSNSSSSSSSPSNSYSNHDNDDDDDEHANVASSQSDHRRRRSSRRTVVYDVYDDEYNEQVSATASRRRRRSRDRSAADFDGDADVLTDRYGSSGNSAGRSRGTRFTADD